MRVLVSLKRVVDHNIVVRPDATGTAADLRGLKMSINPFDENALEAAVQLKEQGHASEVIAVSFGDSTVQDSLRQALALGADRAIWGETPGALDQLAIARLLRHLALREAVSLVLLGKQAIDQDAGQTAPMLAALLDWPQAVAVSQLEFEGQTLRVVRELDRGNETLRLRLPAVISADLRLNAPRFVKLPELMKARRQAIEALDCAALGIDLAPRVTGISVRTPPARAAAQRVHSVAELMAKLRDEARVIA